MWSRGHYIDSGKVMPNNLAAFSKTILAAMTRAKRFLARSSVSPITLLFFLILKKFKLNGSPKKWLIEYGILASAYSFYKKNPSEFEKAVEKAKNKKEFTILTGIS